MHDELRPPAASAVRATGSDEASEHTPGAALVTGASRGIGRAIALELARQRQHVFVNFHHDEASAAETVRLICERGGSAESVRADVSDADDVQKMFERIDRGERPLQVLINSAGVTHDALFSALEEDDWRRVLDTNLQGVFYCSRRAAERMLGERYGRIVNLSSVMAQRPNKGVSSYAASKGAIEALTRALGIELGYKRITVNAVAPGFVLTDMTADYELPKGKAGFPLNALRRPGKADEIAAVVGFLASPRASFVNGQVWTVDGGAVNPMLG